MTREQHAISIGDGRERAVRVTVWETTRLDHPAWVATAEVATDPHGWEHVRGRGDTREQAVESCLDAARQAWRQSVRP